MGVLIFILIFFLLCVVYLVLGKRQEKKQIDMFFERQRALSEIKREGELRREQIKKDFEQRKIYAATKAADFKKLYEDKIAELENTNTVTLYLEQVREDFLEAFKTGFIQASADFEAKYIFIDFETNDLPVNYTIPSKESVHIYPYALQAACLVFNESAELIDRFVEIISVHKHVIFNKEAIKINNLTLDKCQKSGVPITEFFSFLDRYISKDIRLVAHNVEFDNLILNIEAVRNDYKLPSYRTFCTMKTTRKMVNIYKNGDVYPKYPKLIELVRYAFFNGDQSVSIDNLHNAEVDVKLCAMCFFKLELGLKYK